MADTYGPLERSIAKSLTRIPGVKQGVKSCYARLAYIRRKKTFRQKTAYKIYPVYNSRMESFFGYYDKSPTCSDGWILCHIAPMSTRKKPVAGQPVLAALFEPKGKKPFWLAQTYAYNWQQGARLHWLNSDYFILNDFDPGKQKYISRIFSRKGPEEENRFDHPVQDSFNTDFFLSVNVRRLTALCPDYGYPNLPGLSRKELAETEDDGIFKIDFNTGKTWLLVSLADICRIHPGKELKGAAHAVNHLLISPSGKRSAFIHRYYSGQRRFDRLMMTDTKTGNTELLADYGMISHGFWADEHTILGFLRGPDGKDAYWLIDTETGSFTRLSGDNTGGLGDGHPNVCGKKFVTDTYPDKARMQHLLLADLETGDFEELGLFFHGFSFDGQTRCDLHPRFSADCRSIFFDSVFSGKRKLYRMDLC